MIIGIVVVVILLVAIGVAAGFAFWWRKRKNQASNTTAKKGRKNVELNAMSVEINAPIVLDVSRDSGANEETKSIELDSTERSSKNVELTATSGYTITDIEIQHQIGGGNFGEVYQGLWQDTTVVALKKLKGVEQLKEFEAEANTLK